MPTKNRPTFRSRFELEKKKQDTENQDRKGRLKKGMAAVALGAAITGGFVSAFNQAEAQAPQKKTKNEAPPVVSSTVASGMESNDQTSDSQETIKDIVGIVTRHVDKDSVELDVEGDRHLYNCAGDASCQKEIDRLKLGTGLLVQYTETKDHQNSIKNVETLYEPETDEMEKAIEANYVSMKDNRTIQVTINNQLKLLPLQEHLQNQNLDSQFSHGTKVTLLVREDPQGNMTVGAINEL
jgi:hypothetical protein